MDSERNYRITRAILVMTGILMSVVLGSLGVTHNQNPSTETPPGIIAMFSKQPQTNKGGSGQNANSIPVSLASHSTNHSQARALYKTGLITQNETWTSANTYQLDNVVVGEGVTLTIEDGTKVQVMGGDGITVQSGGTLRIKGSPTAPVTLSPYSDAFGTAITALAGSHVEVANTTIEQAETGVLLFSNGNTVHDVRITKTSTALKVYNTNNVLSNITVNASENGLVAEGGTLVITGEFNNIANKAVQACNWTAQNCSVDASVLQVDGASVQTAQVCGQVWTNSFDSQNCDGSASLANQLTLQAQAYTDRSTALGTECSNAAQDPCQPMEDAKACIAAGTATIAFPFAITDSQPSALIMAATNFTQASPAQFTDVVSLLARMASVYQTCSQ